MDVDRYVIDGESRQVMLSARELNYGNVPANAKSWFNEHMQYTHGYGLTMSPVNVVTPEGLPDLFIQDIPPKSKVGIEITQPEIYYGELTDRFVLVGTKAKEFDFPNGDENAYTTYAGDGGVPVGTTLRQALFSLYYQSFDILLSNYITADSKIMFRRPVKERVSTLAPFLRMNRDPYLVVVDGRMKWMMDAYTTTDRYYADLPAPRESINYIRNSVKVVMDAYHGTVDFYVSDVWAMIRCTAGSSRGPRHGRAAREPRRSRALRGLLRCAGRDVSGLPHDGPDGVLQQGGHVGGTEGAVRRREQLMQSYYLIMSFLERKKKVHSPGALRADQQGQYDLVARGPLRPENYDDWSLSVPEKRDLRSRQIEALDQTPEISEQMTLWSQAGSRVIRGNLLVIPVEDSLMYVEAIYLQPSPVAAGAQARHRLVREHHRHGAADGALQKVFGRTTAPRFRSRMASRRQRDGGDQGSNVAVPGGRGECAV